MARVKIWLTPVDEIVRNDGEVLTVAYLLLSVTPVDS